MSETHEPYVVSHHEYEQWLEGYITPEEALRALLSDLGEVESELQPLEAEKQVLRARISEVVDRIGGKAEIAGFGRLEITAPVKTASYDRKALDALMLELFERNELELARRIAACRQESARAGGLRITREKPQA